jgi:hypothetical protein
MTEKPTPLSPAWLAARSTLDEETGCMTWTGACGNGTDPVARIGGKVRAVRRALWEQSSGKSLGTRRMSVTCTDPLCVNREHLVALTKGQLQKGKKRKLETILKWSVTQRRNSALSDQDVAAIRASEVPTRELMPLYPVSRDYLNKIRSGIKRKDYSSPFAGLLA